MGCRQPLEKRPVTNMPLYLARVGLTERDKLRRPTPYRTRRTVRAVTGAAKPDNRLVLRN
jgi:hypothetical protein